MALSVAPAWSGGAQRGPHPRPRRKRSASGPQGRYSGAGRLRAGRTSRLREGQRRPPDPSAWEGAPGPA
eukprot:4844543-Alexandrium_andersonii.AAC.1